MGIEGRQVTDIEGWQVTGIGGQVAGIEGQYNRYMRAGKGIGGQVTGIGGQVMGIGGQVMGIGGQVTSATCTDRCWRGGTLSVCPGVHLGWDFLFCSGETSSAVAPSPTPSFPASGREPPQSPAPHWSH